MPSQQNPTPRWSGGEIALTHPVSCLSHYKKSSTVVCSHSTKECTEMDYQNKEKKKITIASLHLF